VDIRLKFARVKYARYDTKASSCRQKSPTYFEILNMSSDSSLCCRVIILPRVFLLPRIPYLGDAVTKSCLLESLAFWIAARLGCEVGNFRMELNGSIVQERFRRHMVLVQMLFVGIRVTHNVQLLSDRISTALSIQNNPTYALNPA
jgi:hypothetical protein